MRRPPFLIPTSPRVQPSITWVLPIVTGNGWLRSQDASNSLPFEKFCPT